MCFSFPLPLPLPSASLLPFCYSLCLSRLSQCLNLNGWILALSWKPKSRVAFSNFPPWPSSWRRYQPCSTCIEHAQLNAAVLLLLSSLLLSRQLLLQFVHTAKIIKLIYATRIRRKENENENENCASD